MFTANSKVHSFTVTTEQTILAQDIRDIIWNSDGKIDGIKAIRLRYAPIGLRDAKEIYEAIAGSL